MVDRSLERAAKFSEAFAMLNPRTESEPWGRKMMSKSLDKIRGCIFGGAVGDALGYPVEFASRSTILDVYGEDGIQAYKINRLSQAAQISDDTQMTLFTAVGILAAKTSGENSATEKTQYLYKAYLDWLDTQKEEPQADYPNRISWIMDEPELHERRAPGNTCMSALRSGVCGTLSDPINHSKGCGGVMRVAPIALYAGESADPHVLESEAASAAAITHGHPLGYLPAAMLVYILNRIVYGGENYDLAAIVNQSMIELARWQPDNEHVTALNTLINKAVSFSVNDRSDYENIAELGGGWVAEETLAIAIYCSLRHEKDFSAGIIAAVNHDGDSDSTGAVTGNILGAMIGYDAIEDKWKHDLELKETILEISDDVAKAACLNWSTLSTDSVWREKYVRFQRNTRVQDFG